MLLPFELDPEIIHHIIYSQAGSIGKAIIELLMNSVDARATAVQLSMTKEGFKCADDGNGFANREDVVRYFGRFGTPHEEGDATYGRFRLGRGQIMAHASTIWRSNDWQMTVDTRAMGYSYDLEKLDHALPGCSISGQWYEPLTDSELMSAVQEIRDLVRYTPVSVELNGRVITRDPRTERWDAEDEFAWYRAKEDGAVSIYNQGVLVRHDPGHMWGAGGLIVSKKAIALNVSRTEILRKTCPVWKAIAKQFGALADDVRSRLGDHRKTEASREKSARALLAGDPNIVKIYEKEEVITLLPGKRHVTMQAFLSKCYYSHNKRQGNRFTVVENGFEVPKGEAIAREGIAVVVHPQTLGRFGCYSAHDLLDAIDRIQTNVREDIEKNGTRFWGQLQLPELVAFSTLRDAFVERTALVTERDALDKEARRAWTALRTILHHYAAVLTGGERCYHGSPIVRGGKSFQILLGQSNTAEAWTDGDSYIAFTVDVVKRLKTVPLKAAAYIFSLIEHEVAHEGDSLDCGHDEAFYQRFHDLTIKYAQERQWYMHAWLMRYTTSMEGEGKRARGEAWRERYLVDRAGTGRTKRGLPRAIDDVATEPAVVTPEENMGFIDYQNARLVQAGVCPPPPNWTEVLDRARATQQQIEAELRARRERQEAEDAAELAALDAYHEEMQREDAAARQRLAPLLGVDVDEISDAALLRLTAPNLSDDELRMLWSEKPWAEYERQLYGDNYDKHGSEFHDPDDAEADVNAGEEPLHNDPAVVEAGAFYPAELRALIQPGETNWALERNAAAAGFYRVEDYLKWRAEVNG
ncbi:DNA mismatch repair protein MutL [Burkholderia territorii]|uniref:DNA mismatch repair protein MutL n=1 Tax=Burkholderia territorii TaxID=1503055 RepID=A0A105V4H1_9BURK|nr:ATP-binding protein [Burkholderia territorii]KVV40936.1 DNA mismatch repair protein MutL [Burkholderia territorii]KVX33883.1 DNA mismatch repair protein MutL [Burkholderia territorii]